MICFSNSVLTGALKEVRLLDFRKALFKTDSMKKILYILFLLPGLIIAQQGTISGTVVDKETAETMISLPVIAIGTDLIGITDLDGKYSIKLDPGVYSIKFTYIGYHDRIVTDVEVNPNEVTTIDISMETSISEMKEVIVTAKAIERTENSLLMLRKNSDKITDAISAQEMSRMVAGNAASAIVKITGTSVQEGKYVVVRGLGDRYSISQLNGLPMPSIDPYRNSAQLDLIPTKLLDNIMATKTFTPDQPGTFTGGNIDLRTKSFPEEKTFSLALLMGYNTQNNLRNDFLTHTGGKGDNWGYGLKSRERPDILSSELFKEYSDKNAELEARFGDSIAAVVIDQTVNSMSFAFDTLHKKSMLDYGISFSYGDTYATGQKSSLGFILGASYKQEYEHRSDDLQASWYVFDIKAGNLMNSGNYRKTESTENPVINGFSGLAYQFNDLHNVDFKLMYNHNATKGTTYIIGEDGDNILDPSFKIGRAITWQERQMINCQMTGNHRFPALGNIEAEWKGSIVNASREEPNLRFFSSQYNSETGSEGIPLANVNDPFYFWRTLTDNSKTGAVDISIPVINEESQIKVGGFLSYKDRNFDEYRYIVSSPQSAAKFTGEFSEFFSPENNGLLRVEELSGGRNKYVIGNFINDATRVENSYAGREDVSAAYAMLSVRPFRNLKLITGARLESTDIFVQSKIVQIIGEAPDSTNTGNIKVTDILPSVNVILTLSNNMNLRAGFNKTLARPNLREIAPFASFDPLIDEFFIGNPKLTTTDIQNYDLRWEWFTQPGDIFAISGFYKEFKNPISLQYLNSSNPEFQYANAKRGKIGGIEIELRKSLGFIDSFFEYFKISGNITLITSSMDVISQSGLEPDNRPFEGQSPVLTNLICGYQDPATGWDVQLAYNFTGERLVAIGLASPDIYESGVSTLDAVISKRMGNVSLKLSAGNLLNSKYTTSSEYLGQEYLTKLFTRGRSFDLTLAYEL